ncbi:aminotran_1_2 domain-containing protein, partial [Haematococcus lacustris]
MVPIPQYPLYSASIKLYGGTLVPYLLNESQGWALDMADLKESLEEARAEGRHVRGLVFINPGNPTGQCLSVENLQELIRFAHDEKIVLMADEDQRPFVSAKKVMFEMGEPFKSGVELLSFHTVSKGTGGECGLRGGYVEMTNIHPGALEQIYKCASINLCPNTIGQVAMSVLVNPPAPGDVSYQQYEDERNAELASLKRRAQMVTDAFNAMEGVTCNFTEGAMYAFPKVKLPPNAIAAAQAAGKAPDAFYCLKLLEATGISTVSGT